VENGKQLPLDDSEDGKDEVLSIIASAIPYLGGPISNILNGATNKRKYTRIVSFLNDFMQDYKDFQVEINEEYIKTEDFEELLENTLTKVADERNEEKRNLYKSYLKNVMKTVDDTYDDKFHILKVLEQLRFGHILIIKAIIQEPDPKLQGLSRSIGMTLKKRVPELDREQIKLHCSQLQDMKITKFPDLNLGMTADGAQNLQQGLTNWGQKIIKYILE